MIPSLAALASAALWAYASLCFARVAETSSAVVINLLKCFGGFLCLALLWALLEGPSSLQLDGAHIGLLTASSVLGLALGDSAFFLTLSRIGPANTLLISALIPPVTAVLSAALLGEQMGLFGWLGLGLAGLGVVLVVRRRPDAPAVSAAGLGFGFALVLLTSFGNVLTKMGGGAMSGLAISVFRLGAVLPVLLLVVAAMGPMAAIARPWRAPRRVAPLMRGTFAGTVIGIWLLMIAFADGSVGVGTAMAGTSPVWVLPIAYWVEGTVPERRAVVGALIATSGVLLLAFA